VAQEAYRGRSEIGIRPVTPSAHLLPPRCPRSVTSVTKIRFLRLLRFFAANIPNLFTADYADSADKKAASVLSVSSCKIRPCVPCVPWANAPSSALRFLRPLRLLAANPLPPSDLRRPWSSVPGDRPSPQARFSSRGRSRRPQRADYPGTLPGNPSFRPTPSEASRQEPEIYSPAKPASR
jgi:hypothetical protein